ncbi:MAG: multicopper oxidase family protein [Candidatus Dadabacteria bacterium]|nr:MAG: multicopper oxidase family protein [Candidatus Dadabacteria bacterium]
MTRAKRIAGIGGLVAGLLAFGGGPASARILGLTGTEFTLYARHGHISTADGGSYLMWGYTAGPEVQYPGPTLIVNEGDTVTIHLTNLLDDRAPVATFGENVSMVFPGQGPVTAACDAGSTCEQGLMTLEAPPNQTVTYTFTASKPGTYLYHSGTHPELQMEMGMVGALIVRPAGFDPAAPTAYGHPDTAYDREYLFLLTEMDPTVHQKVEAGQKDLVDNAAYWPVYWMLNGRTAPDTLLDAGVTILPNQPYNCFPRMHPGEKLLLRVVSASRDLHPFHTHGNHVKIIARDGRLLESSPGMGPDLATKVYTIKATPGFTYDGIFEWTGKNLGWDIYGTGPGHEHNCLDADGDGYADADSDYPWEWCADHGKPFPVTLPEKQDLTFGGFYSGSPFLGLLGDLPPGEGGLNPNAGFAYMWHSHSEKELTNFDIFPGGMMSMLVIEPPGVPINE